MYTVNDVFEIVNAREYNFNYWRPFLGTKVANQFLLGNTILLCNKQSLTLKKTIFNS